MCSKQDYHGIDAYFTTAEFAEISEYEKLRMRNMKQNYEKMIEVGLDVPPPDFMRNPAGRRRKPRIVYVDSDDDDESWVPGRSRARKRIPTFKVPLKKPKLQHREKPCTITQPPLDESDDGFEALAHIDLINIELDGVDTSEEANRQEPYVPIKRKQRTMKKTSKQELLSQSGSGKRRYPLREGTRKSYTDLEAPEDDVFVYCEDCHELYENGCPTHPLTIIEDTQVPPKCKNRAGLSLPPGLAVKDAGIEGAGEGVWTEKFFPKGVCFGPYGGEIVDENVGRESGYAWEIFCDKKKMYFINGQNKRISNWMRYVNCARNETEQNLVAYQYRGQIYYRSFKPIQPGTELLVFYGEEYAKELGIEEDEFKNDGMHHECEFCGIHFTGKLFLLKHLKYRHHQHVDLTLYVSKKKSPIGRRALCKVTTGNRSQHRVSLKEGGSPESIRHTNRFGLVGKLPYHQKLSKISKQHSNACEVVSSDMKKHERIHTEDKPLQCWFCSRAFKDGSCLRLHERTHTGEKPYKCNMCDYSCKRSGDLKTHERTHTGVKPYQCGQCQKTFTHMGSLKVHERIHTGEKPYKCRHCHKAFTRNEHLEQHERTHTGVKPYQCVQCQKTFTHMGSLKTHERIHTGEKPYKCRHCHKAFTLNHHLKAHERIHTGVKPYKCNVCDYSCKQLGNLKMHERTHTGVKPYKCNVCDYSCKVSGDLKKHERTHTGVKPYKCNVCDYSCKLSCNLKRHERIHTGVKPYKCRHCEMAFTVSNNLKAHERIHTGEKPYKCNVCDYSCNQLRDLKTHERIHTGVTPYKCKLCEYTCSQSSNLKKHERTHTNNN